MLQVFDGHDAGGGQPVGQLVECHGWRAGHERRDAVVSGADRDGPGLGDGGDEVGCPEPRLREQLESGQLAAGRVAVAGGNPHATGIP